jgi:hypothetical protein
MWFPEFSGSISFVPDNEEEKARSTALRHSLAGITPDQLRRLQDVLQLWAEAAGSLRR